MHSGCTNVSCPSVCLWFRHRSGKTFHKTITQLGVIGMKHSSKSVTAKNNFDKKNAARGLDADKFSHAYDAARQHNDRLNLAGRGDVQAAKELASHYSKLASECEVGTFVYNYFNDKARHWGDVK